MGSYMKPQVHYHKRILFKPNGYRGTDEKLLITGPSMKFNLHGTNTAIFLASKYLASEILNPGSREPLGLTK